MFNIGDKIKLNPELVTDQSILSNPEAQFGDLGYLVAFLDFELEVVNVFNDSYQGDMVDCKVLNYQIDGLMAFKIKDVVSAGPSKYKLDYEIVDKDKALAKEIERLKALEVDLVTARGLFKASGKQISSPELRQNWAEITATRTKIKNLESGKTKPSTNKISVKLNTKRGSRIVELECAPDKVEQNLMRLIRSERKASREIKPVVKVISGNTKYEMIGKVMVKPDTISKLNENFAKNIINEHKKPVNSDRHVGIEIEMLSPKTIDQMKLEFIKARLHRFVNIGTDGSISTDTSGVHTMELRLLIPESQLESKLKEICRVLKVNDCYVNRSCGLHVHLDMRNRNAEQAYSNLFQVQDLMFETQPSTRRKSEYARKNKTKKLTLDEFSNIDRYSAINTTAYSKYQTIEVRLHEGSTKFRDIYNWSKFLVDVVNASPIQSAVNNLADLKKANITSESVIEHIESRLEEYSA